MLTTAPLRAKEPYPNRLIRIVVPVGPGFNTDALARMLAEELRKKARVQVLVDNRAGGAGGSVGAEFVARSENDGYTLLFSSPGPLGVNKLLYKGLGYEPLDLTPVGLMSEAANVLLVRAGSFKTLGALVEFAKANPGKLNYGSGGVGTSTHLSMEVFKTRTGTNIVHVPYKGSAAAAVGLLSGQVDMFFGELGASIEHIKSGRVAALGVGTSSSHRLLPGVPPIAATLPGFTSTVWYGLVAPPKTPAPIVDKLSSWVVEIMKQPEVVAKLQAVGGRAIGAPAGEFGRFIREDLRQLEKVIRDANITAI
ncbi:tripartite tricarboxylate transporter substrate binding protein [Cupriavidus sp. P-10]|uniref:Bug family tripartite tricarboxylate transporter substrate binding protein n=1 Tax=Cupriavidus sp. P-10 TaxID=2027911 RepID=UPI00131498BD|nr:tripartite tricarboxylate transporter substrate-binding protein [Cupriavidus sp. P-10]BDB27873.1 tripartite tricarboxylate transporter substrate binding protein [Cupriavidus sp. P-10]